MVFTFYHKKFTGSGINFISNQQLTNKLNKPINRKFERRRVYSSFKDNVWSVDLADIQLIRKQSNGIRYLLCVIDIFSKYALVLPLKPKKGVIIVNVFQNILDSSKRKLNKTWVDQGSKFYNSSFKKKLR